MSWKNVLRFENTAQREEKFCFKCETRNVKTANNEKFLKLSKIGPIADILNFSKKCICLKLKWRNIVKENI